MGDSSGSVSVDVERISIGRGQEHLIQTRHGPISVAVYGDQDKIALVTYPDVGLNHMSCFQGLFFCPEAASLLLHNFCIYHISPPGHQFEAAPISSDVPVPTVDELAEQVVDVLDFFGLGSVMCLGVTAGAYILTLFSLKWRERCLGLILVSPLCRAPSWTEWLYNKVMSNLLYYYGMCGAVQEFLLQRYFSKEVRGCTQVPESEIVKACRSWLNQRESTNAWRFLQAINSRHDLTKQLNEVRCPTLIFVGEDSPFVLDAYHMISKMDCKYNKKLHRRDSWMEEVHACGSMVTEEQPLTMVVPMSEFLKIFRLYSPSQLSGSPRSPLSPSYICAEHLSPEGMGVNLKRIKTRISLEG